MSGFMLEMGVYAAGLICTIYYMLGDSGQKAKIFVGCYYGAGFLMAAPQMFGNPPPTVWNFIGLVMMVFLLIFFALKFQYLDKM
jgi:hypothetical protein